ncbi:MAG: hypothetical protein ACK4SJ_11215 [Sphingorhabdus sp.]
MNHLLRTLFASFLLISAGGYAQTRIDLARDVKGVLPPANGGIAPADKAKLDGIATGATANSTDAQLRDRTTHTGEQPISTITGLQTALDAKADDADLTAHTAAADPHPTYLTAAEGNAAYAALSHTQAISTVSGLQPALDTKVDDSQLSAYGLTLVDDADAAAARITLGLGSAATSASTAFEAAGAVAVHAAAADPHPVYLTATEGNAAYAPIAHVGSGGVAHSNAVASGAAGFMTGADKAKLDAISGTNTGDQTITLSGDLSGSGTGAIATTLATVNAAPQTDQLRKITVDAKGRITATSAVVAGDIPTLNQNTTGSAATLSTGRTFSISGDATGTSAAFNGSANASIPLTLATVNSNVGSFGSASQVPVITVNAKGLVTAVSTVAVSGGGGGGSPGGSTTQIQYNDAGAFAGSANFAWDNANAEVELNGRATLTALGSEPSVPAAGTGSLYARSIAGKVVPKWIGPSGVDYVLQSHLGQNNVRIWRGGATTTATTFAATIGAMPYTGASPTAPTIPALAATNLKTQTFRSVISTGATAGGIAYIRGNQQTIWRGNAVGLGGFYVIHRFGLAALQAGNRAFAGIVDVAANPTNVDPLTTTTPGGVGMAINANSGNWFLVNNITGTARTSLDLGASFPVNTTDLLELALFCPPQCSAIGYRITNLSSGAQTSGNLSTNIPAATTFMAPALWLTNNATAAAATMDFVSTYVETDF